MNQTFQVKAKLLYNKPVKHKYWHCAFKAPQITKHGSPGQFVDIHITDTYESFLRRPFSIHRVTDSIVEILYEVIGKGTEFLSQTKPGEYLDVIGPLGNGFTYGLQLTAYSLPLLVAGGMGVAPLVFLAERLKKSKIQNPMVRLRASTRLSILRSILSLSKDSPLVLSPFDFAQGSVLSYIEGLSKVEVPKSKIIVLLGARTKNEILCEKEFKELGYEIKIATDDGSKGLKGKVTELLEDILSSTFNVQRSTLYACGPRPMLKEISHLSQKYNISAQVSLEEHMACGIGACLGCVVNTTKGFKRVCKEGPIFKAQEVIWK